MHEKKTKNAKPLKMFVILLLLLSNQVLNDHLSQQCSELSTMLQSVAMENAKLISDHETMPKVCSLLLQSKKAIYSSDIRQQTNS